MAVSRPTKTYDQLDMVVEIKRQQLFGFQASFFYFLEAIWEGKSVILTGGLSELF